MSINSLTSWITSSNKFQREYTCLLKKSVCSQISNLIRDNSENDENIVDWAYLISCASILAHSTDVYIGFKQITLMLWICLQVSLMKQEELSSCSNWRNFLHNSLWLIYS